ncbi:hypothetical protein O3P69_014788 [Scylla paramamosain]|uniref:Endonuclease/exonuclease/phosphatase domain-containing protein n=1 Tax=Scylla paramamosain TaxID=85552 RepID=A0AAW0TXV6_SCYPA
MSSSAHQLIARRNLSGYTPYRWCAVCRKATSKAAHVSCEDDSWPNLCHTGCLGDNPVYRCAETGLLREQANIQDPVTFVDREADPSSQPLPPPLPLPPRQWNTTGGYSQQYIVSRTPTPALLYTCLPSYKFRLKHLHLADAQYCNLHTEPNPHQYLASSTTDSPSRTRTSPAPAVPASSTSTAGNTTTRKKKKKYKKKNRSSEVRGASTTQGAGPPRRQTPAKPTQISRYCNRKGHSTEDCHTRTAELRQERLLRQVLAEGGYLAAASPSVTPHLQPFPQSRPFSAQPVNWGHTQGWQWIPPSLRYPQLNPVTPLQAGPQLPPTWEGVQAQQLGVDVPPQLEVMFFRVVLANHSALLLCATYRLPRQGPDSLLYLKEAPDVLLVTHRCQHILLVGDLNHHLERDAYENLLTVQGLKDHVTFPTHERGGILDPVISDLEEDTLSCHQLGLVGSSYHHAVLTQVDMGVARDEATTRTVWLWDRAD